MIFPSASPLALPFCSHATAVDSGSASPVAKKNPVSETLIQVGDCASESGTIVPRSSRSFDQELTNMRIHTVYR